MKSKTSSIYVILIVVIFLAGLLYFIYNSNPVADEKQERVYGNSMLPTISDGQEVIVDYNYYKNRVIQRKDIVVVDFKTRKEDFIKRVIGIPGDNILFGKDGKIYLNNELLIEEYIKGNESYNKNKLYLLLKQLENYNNTIPEGYYLVLGDNRLDSFDSGSYGLVLKEQIIGKVVKII